MQCLLEQVMLRLKFTFVVSCLARVDHDPNILDTPLSNYPFVKVVDILEYVTLGDITTSTQIYYDPDPRSTVVEDDVELLEGHFDIQEEEEDDKDTDR